MLNQWIAGRAGVGDYFPKLACAAGYGAMNSDCVRYMQAGLMRLGYNLGVASPTGNFLGNTRTAVVDFTGGREAMDQPSWDRMRQELFLRVIGYSDIAGNGTMGVGAARPHVEYNQSEHVGEQANCYGYALHREYPTQPGNRGQAYYGDVPNKNPYNLYDVAELVVSDVRAMGGTARIMGNSPSGLVGSNEYRIALGVTTKPFKASEAGDNIRDNPVLLYDYHFMVQTDDGRWAHKFAGFPAEQIAAGQNPSTIEWRFGSRLYDSDILYLAINPPAS